MTMAMNWRALDLQPVPDGRGRTRKIVLITGSREWEDESTVPKLMSFFQPDVVIHGGARGVDEFAHRWCQARPLVVEEEFRITGSLWDTYGKREGHNRNVAMAARLKDYEEAGHRVIVLGLPLPGSRGTFDMFDIALDNDLPVLQYQ